MAADARGRSGTGKKITMYLAFIQASAETIGALGTLADPLTYMRLGVVGICGYVLQYVTKRYEALAMDFRSIVQENTKANEALGAEVRRVGDLLEIAVKER
jgi:hypothetical protein